MNAYSHTSKSLVKSLFVIVFISVTYLVDSSVFAFTERVTATVIKVSDGDTVWVRIGTQKMKLRLLGIDTPEKFMSKKTLRDTKRCGSPVFLGKAATRYAKTKLVRGSRVKVDLRGRGHYGRYLAIIYLPDGQSYNEQVVRDGYSCLYTYRGRKSRQLTDDEWNRLNDALSQAKAAQSGLWKVAYDQMECLCQ